MSVNMKKNGALIPIASLTKEIIPLGFAEYYSTEEREVGCWLDGKPLYQRTIITPFSNKAKGSRSWVTILEGGNGLSPKNAFGVITVDDYASFVMNGVGHDFADASATNYAYATYSFNDSTGAVNAVLRQYFYDGTASGHFTTTVQYTKNSDVAGSGMWTPNGTPAIHYSTAEQLIGTYVDGKPLYEKTYVTNFTSGATSKNISFSDVPIKCMVDLRGLVENAIPFDIHGVFGMSNNNLRVTSNQTYGQYGYVDKTGITLTRAAANLYSPTAAIRVTIRYTKTTD